MKTKFLWCLVLLMALSTIVRAQVHPMDPKNENSIWSRLQNTIENEVLLKAKQNSAKLNSTISSYWKGVEMEVVGKTEYAYENDQLVLAEYYIMDEISSVWNEHAKTENVYDNGLLSSITFYDHDGQTYIPVNQYTFGYGIIDNETLLLSELYREWVEGSGWISIDKIDYVYENGLISGGSEYTWEITEWIEIDRFTTTSANDTTYITYFMPDSENWVEYSREIYPSLTLAELYDIYTEIISEIDFGITYLSLEYPDFIYQEKVGDAWENVDAQITVDHFDMFDGKLKMREIQQLYWEQAWDVSYNNEIWYNQKANPDSATVYVFFEGAKEAAGQEVYTYNNVSQLSEVDFLQNIGNGLELQSTTVLNWELATSNEGSPGISSFKLKPAYPNPFNPNTNITYSLERAGDLNISVYDILGRQVATLISGVQPAGDHSVQFNAGSLSSGMYIVRMEAAGSIRTQKITLLK